MENDKLGQFRSGREELVGNWKMSLDMKSLSVCRKIKRMLELPANNQNDIQSVITLFDAFQRWSLIRGLKFAIRNRSIFEQKIKVETVSGQIKWIQISGILNYRRWGAPEKVLGIIEDITQRQTEESTILSIVSHELRAPLTIVKLNTQMACNIASQTNNSDVLKLLNRADFYINFMVNLLEEYVSNSTVRNSPLKNNYTIFDLSKLITNITTEVKLLYPTHRFLTQIPVDIMVRGDKYKIIQVMVNYLTNAVTYSSNSSQITLDVLVADGQVCVSVKDQGIGIPAGSEELIFEKFFRLRENLSNDQKNKGLGLFLVREIILQHGGTVKVSRAEGRGSIFSFTLPIPNSDQGQAL